MSIRNLGLSKVSRTGAIIGAVAVVLAVIAVTVGWNLYKKASTTTVVAYFSDAMALYPNDRVQIMGVKVGKVDTKRCVCSRSWRCSGRRPAARSCSRLCSILTLVTT